MKFERREVNKLKITLENAVNRVEIEQQNNQKLHQQHLANQQEIFILNKKLKEKQKEITEVNKIVTANVSKNASIKKANTKEILSGSAIGFGILLLLGGIFKR